MSQNWEEKAMTNYIGKKVIVRGVESGVYFGTLADIDGKTVEMRNCRNIWYWSGAANLFQMAEEGIKNLVDSKISMEVESVIFTDICEILPCSETAIACIEGAKPWRI